MSQPARPGTTVADSHTLLSAPVPRSTYLGQGPLSLLSVLIQLDCSQGPMLLVICAKSLLIKSHTIKAHSDFVRPQMVPSHSKPQIANGYNSLYLAWL